MSNKHTQNIDQSYLDQLLTAAHENPQALVLSAYLEEKEKWENKLNILIAHKDEILKKASKLNRATIEKENAIKIAKNDFLNESGIWAFLLYLVGIKSKAKKEFYKICAEGDEIALELKELSNKLNNILDRYDRIAANPPDARQYDLAMIGNTLFKPR